MVNKEYRNSMSWQANADRRLIKRVSFNCLQHILYYASRRRRVGRKIKTGRGWSKGRERERERDRETERVDYRESH